MGKQANDAHKSNGFGALTHYTMVDMESLEPLFDFSLEKNLPEVPVEEQGLSLEFLREFIAEYGLDHGSTATTAHVCSEVVIKTTVERGCTLVEMVRPDLRGRVTHFISHPWDNLFKYTVSALMEACEAWEAETGQKAYVWLDVFAINQHKMQRQEYTKEDIGDMLHRAVNVAQATLACLYPWREPLYIGRAWCLYEAHEAILRSQQVRRPSYLNQKSWSQRSSHVPRHELRFILSPDAREEFEQEALSKEFDTVLQALANIDVLRADAFKKEDKEMILNSIENTEGGSAALNQRVALSLRKWLVESARVIVERRKRTHMNSAKLSQILVNFGRLLGDQAQSAKEQQEAEDLFREALSIDKSILALHQNDPQSTVLVQLQNVARDHFMLGLCLYDQGRFADSLERLESAISYYREAGDQNEGAPQDSLYVARVLTRMGPAQMKLQRWDEATNTLRSAAHIFEGCKEDGAEFAECLGFLAYVLSRAPEHEEYPGESSDIRHRVLELRVNVQGENHPDVAMALRELASQEQAAGNLQGAIEYLKRALAIYCKVYGNDHSKTQHVRRKILVISAAQSRASKRMNRLSKDLVQDDRKDSLPPTEYSNLRFLPEGLSSRNLQT